MLTQAVFVLCCILFQELEQLSLAKIDKIRNGHFFSQYFCVPKLKLIDSLREESAGAIVLPHIQWPVGPQAMAGLRVAVNPVTVSEDNGQHLQGST